MIEIIKEEKATEPGYKEIHTITGVRIIIPDPKKDKLLRHIPAQAKKFEEHWKKGKNIAGIIFNEHFYTTERWFGRETVCTAIIKEKTVNGGGVERTFSMVDYIHTPEVKATCCFSLKDFPNAEKILSYAIRNTNAQLSFYKLSNGYTATTHPHKPAITEQPSKTISPNFDHIDAIQALKDGWAPSPDYKGGRQLILKKDGATITRHLPDDVPTLQLAISMLAAGKL